MEATISIGEKKKIILSYKMEIKTLKNKKGDAHTKNGENANLGEVALN